jgi:uncharacterized membrane protein YwaF
VVSLRGVLVLLGPVQLLTRNEMLRHVLYFWRVVASQFGYVLPL